MKSKRVIDSFNKIGPSDAAKKRMLAQTLQRADSDKFDTEKMNVRKTLNWKRIVPAAVCLAAALMVTLPVITYFHHLNSGQNPGTYDADNENLTVLPLPKNLGDMGYEGYMAFHIEDLENGNPWNKSVVLETMPVFQNPGKWDDVNGGFTNSDDWHIRTEMNPAVDLPEPFRFTYSDTTPKQAEAVMNYLLEQYADEVGMEKPKTAIFCDYTYSGKRHMSYCAFENSDQDILQKILDYNFNRVVFSPNDAGQLWLIDRDHWKLTEKLGDYPVITAKQAEEKLLQGEYISSVLDQTPRKDLVAKVELIYRTSRYDEVFMPYYKFYVELDHYDAYPKLDNGLIKYGVFYVPAVASKYVEGFKSWSGEMN